MNTKSHRIFSVAIFIITPLFLLYEFLIIKNSLLYRSYNSKYLYIFYLFMLTLFIIYNKIKQKFKVEYLYFIEPLFHLYSYFIFGLPLALVSIFIELFNIITSKLQRIHIVIAELLLLLIIIDLQMRNISFFLLLCIIFTILFIRLFYLLQDSPIRSIIYLLTQLFSLFPFMIYGLEYYKIVPEKVILPLYTLTGITFFIISLSAIFAYSIEKYLKRKNLAHTELIQMTSRVISRQSIEFLNREFASISLKTLYSDIFFIGKISPKQDVLDITYLVEQGKEKAQSSFNLFHSLSIMAIKSNSGYFCNNTISTNPHLTYHRIDDTTVNIQSFLGCCCRDNKNIPVVIIGFEASAQNMYSRHDIEICLLLKQWYELNYLMVSRMNPDKHKNLH